ncbi:hypothetical protein DL98DRAFT_442586, partial [Cadophora sp. DSE1049]
VPGYTEVYGNELINSLAKQIITLALNTNETNFIILDYKAKQVNTREWKSILD